MKPLDIRTAKVTTNLLKSAATGTGIEAVLKPLQKNSSLTMPQGRWSTKRLPILKANLVLHVKTAH